jgi:hypothetical protein
MWIVTSKKEAVQSVGFDQNFPSIPGECLFKLTTPICDGHSEPIFLRVTHTVMNDSTVGIPVKPNAQSEGKPNGIPG